MTCVVPKLASYDPDQCDPVASAESIPTYVVPFFDLLKIKLAVTTDDVGAMARYIGTSPKLVGPGVGRSDDESTVARTKRVSFKQCTGYSYISIQQNYFSR